MTKLDLKNIGNINHLAVPIDQTELSLTSPAISFFTDFTQTQPLIIESSVSAVDTVKLMKKTHVRLKLVVNEQGDLVGIVSADDLIERKIVQKLQKGDTRDELSVTEFMTPRSGLQVLDYEAVKLSSIKKVIETLKNSGRHHCLVVDTNENLIRGLFSVSDISRKLKLNIDIQNQPSFSTLADHFD
ncbi:CBS domain-containing protein [Glaciecola sp. XM2]|jgi:CBS domain-containing protein|uniref:CBS domain-containing protein n=1 Tax=Glaciecola sp. XM2 TaxID=1914931 RepID=UPI001BDEB6B8|nr:CBS domain-containing protein [Glaciecola sp. XM2]MBT1451794.1 CBS domain-containing protein [Glaciecola sp. XM2]